MYLWMKVTKDEYELPLAVADTARELAEMLGTTENNINSSLSHANNPAERRRTAYRRIEIPDKDFLEEGL